MMPLEGIDVSHNNGAIDWSRVNAAGISFAFIKATEGESWEDPKWQTNLAGCQSTGIMPGLYHFYHHDVDPVAQATHFLKTIGEHASSGVPIAIDVEAPDDGAGSLTYGPDEVVHRVTAFVNAVTQAVGRSPLIYTYPAAWKELTGDSDSFAATCPLWIASYEAAPSIPNGWTGATIWQYTDKGNVDGIETIVDRDRFDGDTTALQSISTTPK